MPHQVGHVMHAPVGLSPCQHQVSSRSDHRVAPASPGPAQLGCAGCDHPLFAAAVQIGLFAIPFVTIVGWVMGHPFSLGFDPFAGGNLSITSAGRGSGFSANYPPNPKPYKPILKTPKQPQHKLAACTCAQPMPAVSALSAGILAAASQPWAQLHLFVSTAVWQQALSQSLTCAVPCPADVAAALVLLLSVMHAAHMINDAESHWLEGMQLVVTYFM